MRIVGFLLGLAVLLAGCQGNPRLTIRVQSGLRAGSDLRHVDVAVFEGALGCPPSGASIGGGSVEVLTSLQQRLEAGTLNVAELALPQGVYTIHAQGMVADRLVRRCLTVTLVHDRVARVPLSVSCLDVVCPAPSGSAAFTECLNGHCVDPRCDLDDPNTTMYCCDRSDPAAQCDDDPTICRAGADCVGGPACLGPASCVTGVCIEGDDTCPSGQHCSAVMGACVEDGPALDAGSIDAGSSIDAPPPDAFAFDAYVPPGVDADLDAHRVVCGDGRREPVEECDDGNTMSGDGCDALCRSEVPDAYVAPMPDAWAPDAAEPSPDAFVIASGEDCAYLGDEDSNGLSDCADPACASLDLCVLPGCAPLPSVTPPLEPIPTPSHWFRGDHVIRSAALGVCAWIDMVGRAHFFSMGAPPTHVIGLGGAVSIDADASLRAASDLGVTWRGNYTIFLVTQRAGTVGVSTDLLHIWAPVSSTDFFSNRQSSPLPAHYTIGVRTGVYAVGMEGTTARVIERIEARSLRRGASISANVTYDRNGTVIPLTLASGSDTPATDAFAGLPRTDLGGASVGAVWVAEILVYAGTLGAADTSDVRNYLSARYP
ncbi:MAG: hypothetical protein K1X94_08300 [Sandaracinaceae bacterium]|nr:hypothetical protein [Sandaracinaceae bacterium]